MDAKRDLLTVSEVTARLRVSQRTTYNLIYRGELRACRVGYLLRIPVAELDRLLALRPLNPLPAAATRLKAVVAAAQGVALQLGAPRLSDLLAASKSAQP